MNSDLESRGPERDARRDASRYGLVSRLADDLAHEIKNPLSSVLINLELIRQRVHKGDMQVALDRTAVIEHEVHRVHDLVDGLLRLLRPHKDGVGPYSVADTVSSVLPLVTARAHAVAVEVTVGQLPLEAYTAVEADALRVAFLVSALDTLRVAHDARGTVVVEAEVTANLVAVILRITVGQPTRVAARDPASEESLALARELIVASGGRIEESGQGYVIHVPLTKR